MKTQLMQVDTTSGNRVYAEDIQYSTNIYTEIFRGGMGITESTNTDIFKLLGVIVNNTSIQITKGTLLIYYNGSNSSTIIDPDQIAICRYNGNDVTINQGSSITLYVGYNETQRVNESGSNYVAYRDYFFQTTSFPTFKLSLSIPANLTIPELMKQYSWNYPAPKSFTVDLLETPIDAADILTEGSVETSQLADQSVTSSKIANGSIGKNQLDQEYIYSIEYDYNISNEVELSNVLNGILNKESCKIRILSGEYNISSKINLGQTASNNNVYIYCEPNVIINGFVNNTINQIFVVTNNGGRGKIIWDGGTLNLSYNISENITLYTCLMTGFNEIKNITLYTPYVSEGVTGNIIMIYNCNNIHDVDIIYQSTNYTLSRNNIGYYHFYSCNNISNVTCRNPEYSTGEYPMIYSFYLCSNISNVNIESVESNKIITYFLSCTCISNVFLNMSGIFRFDAQRIVVFSYCSNISNININAQNYGYSESHPDIVKIFGGCGNISQIYARFTDVSNTGNNQMITFISNCRLVSHVFAMGRLPMKGFIVLSKGVTNNFIQSSSQLTSVAYSQSYASMDMGVQCCEGINGGLNYVDNI